VPFFPVLHRSPVHSLHISVEQQKSDLADSIKFAVESVNGQTTQSTTSTKRSVIGEGETKSPNVASGVSETVTPGAVKADTPTTPNAPESTGNKGPAIVETVQVILPGGENLFTGLVQNVGTLNLNGVIMEAFKIAQVSLGLFAQQLAGSLATTLAVPINASAFIIPTQ